MTTTTGTVRRADTDADFARFGVDRSRIQAWEDGRRENSAAGRFEWWYFEVRLRSGAIVIAFMDKMMTDATGTLAPVISIRAQLWLRPYGDEICFPPQAFSADTSKCDVRIDSSFCRDGGGGIYHLEFHGAGASNRPGIGEPFEQLRGHQVDANIGALSRKNRGGQQLERGSVVEGAVGVRVLGLEFTENLPGPFGSISRRFSHLGSPPCGRKLKEALHRPGVQYLGRREPPSRVSLCLFERFSHSALPMTNAQKEGLMAQGLRP